MILALYQLLSIDRSIADTLKIFDRACANAKANGADLVIFPEMAVTGYNIGADRIRKLAEPHDGAMVKRLMDMAKRHKIGIVCGFPEANGQNVFNSAVLIDSSGTVQAICRKVHLFGDVDREVFSPAESLCSLVEVGDWTVGLAICYDIEFPELVRSYALAGAEIILVPTANMLPYVGVPKRIVPARAEENEIYIAYANRVGVEGPFEYCGLSCVIGPDGVDIARAGEALQDEMIFAEISKEELKNVRKSISHLNDRRSDLYR